MLKFHTFLFNILQYFVKSKMLVIRCNIIYILLYGWVRKILWKGNGNPLWYSCLENPMDRGAWWATVQGVQSQTRLSNFTFFHFQFSSVTQSCPTLCDPTDCSMPGLPVHPQLLELTQIFTESVMPSIHLILCHAFLLPPAIFPSIRVFSNESFIFYFFSFIYISWRLITLQYCSEWFLPYIDVNQPVLHIKWP